MRTVNLELAKQLKEAGYPQRPVKYYWSEDKPTGEALLRNFLKHSDWEIYYASPTADEILEQLPQTAWETYNLLGGRYVIWYRDAQKNRVEFIEDTLSDAAAKMWLYLKKEGLLDVS